MSGVERVAVQLRLRAPVLRAVDELVRLTGASRESIVHDCILAGLPGIRQLAGYETDPAVVAGELLDVLGAEWIDAISDEEAAAFGVTARVLARITEIRAREEKR